MTERTRRTRGKSPMDGGKEKPDNRGGFSRKNLLAPREKIKGVLALAGHKGRKKKKIIKRGGGFNQQRRQGAPVLDSISQKKKKTGEYKYGKRTQ